MDFQGFLIPFSGLSVLCHCLGLVCLRENSVVCKQLSSSCSIYITYCDRRVKKIKISICIFGSFIVNWQRPDEKKRTIRVVSA